MDLLLLRVAWVIRRYQVCCTDRLGEFLSTGFYSLADLWSRGWRPSSPGQRKVPIDQRPHLNLATALGRKKVRSRVTAGAQTASLNGQDQCPYPSSNPVYSSLRCRYSTMAPTIFRIGGSSPLVQQRLVVALLQNYQQYDTWVHHEQVAPTSRPFRYLLNFKHSPNTTDQKQSLVPRAIDIETKEESPHRLIFSHDTSQVLCAFRVQMRADA